MAATKNESELRRPAYGTVTVYRQCLSEAKAAMAEVGENTLDFVSKSVAQRSAVILRRRDRRIARAHQLKTCPSSASNSHKVATDATAQS